ncbi:MAG: sigma-70 family RNA polymerase sigma factor [Ruminococcaceae bacterium]|nr:sigma-70 family RNA polymerase sigma factor [Oscillospiraceae bacterium]
MLSFYLSIIADDDDKEIIIYIYENYYGYMAAAIANEIGDRRYVEDIIHNVMLALINMIEKIDYSDKKKLRNLCTLIAKRKAIDFRRKKSNSDIYIEEYDIDKQTSIESAEDIVISKDSYERLKNSIGELSPIYKEVCQLRFLHRMREKDIAELLDVSEAVVSMRIFRARQKLVEILKKENIDV